MEIMYFKKKILKESCIKKAEKRVVNSTLLNSIVFLKTLYNYIEPYKIAPSMMVLFFFIHKNP